ncbi:hypothetical protein F5051DRAFT_434187 [Lentinula edodes]|nr:hypothetical protein F5051DRAFT_434187 [Lentinula edodes]
MFPRVPSRSPPRYRYMYPPRGNSLFNSEPGRRHTQHTRGSLTLPRLPELDTFFNEDAEAFQSRRAPSEDSLPDPSNILEEVYTPRTVNHGLQAVTPVPPVELSSDEELQFPDPEPIAQPVSIKRGRGRPKKAPVAASHSEIIPVVPSFTFELLLHLLKPDRPITGKLKKTKGKAAKQEPEKRGPIYVSSETDYAAFLSKIAGLVPAPVTGLSIQSFEWHFLSPATGPWLPITTEEGYQSMLGKLRKKHAKDEAYVIIQMKKPVQTIIPATVESVIDEDESSDDDFLGPVAKKGKIDDELEGITQHLQSLYPVGKCEHDPTISCFHYRPGNLHFELTRGRLLVWARDIRDNKPGVSWTQIPLSSALFHASQAIKKTSPNNLSTSATALPALPATPIYPGGYPNMPMVPYGPYPMPAPMPLPMGMYPYGGMPAMQAGGTWTSLAHAEQYSPPSVHVRSSPPAAPEGYALADFCAEYGLSDDIKAGLRNLGYEPGERLTDVTAQEWHNAGIKPVQRSQVMRAYNKYKSHGKHIGK